MIGKDTDRMAKYHVLYNPLAGNGACAEKVRELCDILPGDELEYCDMTKISDYGEFFASVPAEDRVLVAGGDGTLNRFVNDTLGLEYGRDIYYFAAGSGNDFMHDLDAAGNKDKVVVVNKYITNLPVVTVNGKKYKFINGIGYGIDGYCCEVGDAMRAAGKSNINYTSIAIKGLLGKYKRVNASVTVDGVTKEYKKVWLVPTMNGRYYGGGMMPTPDQDRLDSEGYVNTMTMYGKGKLKTLIVFPNIFKGKHVDHTEMVEIRRGHNIKVVFDTPTALQIDGETILGVTEYEVDATAAARSLASFKESVQA